MVSFAVSFRLVVDSYDAHFKASATVVAADVGYSAVFHSCAPPAGVSIKQGGNASTTLALVWFGFQYFRST